MSITRNQKVKSKSWKLRGSRVKSSNRNLAAKSNSENSKKKQFQLSAHQGLEEKMLVFECFDTNEALVIEKPSAMLTL